MEEMTNRRGRILILGDGNFSFSLALCRYNDNLKRPEQFAVVATSFDDADSLLQKYPETRSVLHTLETKLGCKVLHEINATQDLLHQLHSGDQFDHIIFNYPHLGVEDAKLHSHLVGHIFFRCREAVTNGGNVYISLAEGQAQRWRLKEMAMKNGFKFINSGPFMQQQLPGYEMKRHQTGRSFMARLEETNYYVFRKIESEENTEDIMGFLLVSSAPAVSGAAKIDASDVTDTSLSIADTKAVKRCRSDDECSDKQGNVEGAIKKMKDKKTPKARGRMAAAADGYFPIELDAGGAVVYEYECKTCSKRFKLEQGVRTHVYMIHILGQADIFSGFAEKTSELQVDPSQERAADADEKSTAPTNVLFCPICNQTGHRRVFQNEEALYQHKRAKHVTLHNESTIAENAGSIDVSHSSGALYDNHLCACPACDLVFGSEIELSEHIQRGISPPAVVKSECSLCKRLFQNERGLAQHMLSCDKERNIEK